jgi:lysophospholipase L1-like esterase
VDGLSLAPLLRGGSRLERDALFWHYPHYGNQGGRPSGAVRSGKHKLIERFEDGRVELYDLAADPGEAVDLAESQPKQAAMLKRKLHAWRKEVGARMPSPNPSHRSLPPRVLLIGDSISRGYHKPLREILKGRVKVEIIPMNGGATSRGLKRLDEWVGRGEWDLIHFNWGLHDLCWRNPKLKGSGRRDKVNGEVTSTVEQYSKNLADLVTRLEKTGAQLIWATTTPIPKGEPGRFAREELKYNAAAARIMKARGISINDLHGRITPHIAELQKKGGDVHFTRKGSRFLAERVAAVIVKKLGVKKR